jgi:hypothetical protein
MEPNLTQIKFYGAENCWIKRLVIKLTGSVNMYILSQKHEQIDFYCARKWTVPNYSHCGKSRPLFC